MKQHFGTRRRRAFVLASSLFLLALVPPPEHLNPTWTVPTLHELRHVWNAAKLGLTVEQYSALFREGPPTEPIDWRRFSDSQMGNELKYEPGKEQGELIWDPVR